MIGVRGVPERRIFFMGPLAMGSVAESRFRPTRPDPARPDISATRLPPFETADFGPSFWAVPGPSRAQENERKWKDVKNERKPEELKEKKKDRK